MGLEGSLIAADRLAFIWALWMSGNGIGMERTGRTPGPWTAFTPASKLGQALLPCENYSSVVGGQKGDDTAGQGGHGSGC